MDTELLWDIPENWVWSKISDLGAVIAGGTPSSKEPNYWGGNINWISPADLTGYTKKTISKGNKSITEKGLKNSSAKVMPAGSVHFSSRAPIGYVAISAEPVATNQGFKSLVPEQGVFNEFVYYYLKASKQLAEKRASGTTFLELSGKAFGLLPIPIPPTKEQKRIVAKIEELFSELDNGIAALKTAREQLKVYRQAVLKHAFEGKLTEQWRKDNADKLESPEQLLARIQQERETRYQQQLEDWKTAVKAWEANGKEGKKPGKPREQKVPTLPSLEEESLPKLPEGWMWVHPEHLMSSTPYSIGIGPFGSNLKVVDYCESGVPLIFVRNITRNNFTDDLKYVDVEKSEELYAHQVEPLDLVITKMGDPPGDCEIYPVNLPTAVLTADCLKFRVSDEFIDRYFYKSCINSNLVKRQLGLITRGVAQKKISVDRFKTIVLPLPSKAEQVVIASLIQEIFESINKTEEELSNQLVKAEILRQSILKKAFSGQLVPQDPSDEPASELLARIQAEKAASDVKAKKTPAKRGRKTKEVNE